MKIILFLFFLLISTFLQAQELKTIDSLVKKICASANKNKNPSDSTRIDEALTQHFSAYIENIPGKEQEDHYRAVILRLQVTCQLFSDLLSRNDRDETFKPMDSYPLSKLTKEECEGFWKMDRFSYEEPEAYGRTFIEVSDKKWIESLENGTTSELSIKKRSGCEFELSFKKSDNFIKKYLSRPGDRYIYRLIERKSNHYVVCGSSTIIKKYELFKLFF